MVWYIVVSREGARPVAISLLKQRVSGGAPAHSITRQFGQREIRRIIAVVTVLTRLGAGRPLESSQSWNL